MLGKSLEDYELYIYSLQDNNPIIQNSTLSVIRYASNIATVEGDLFFNNKIRLHILEVLRFDKSPPMVSHYGYEVWQDDKKLYWYDSQPHPNDSKLAETYPHHKHIHPDIKHNRIPAFGLSFTETNLPFLIKEINKLLQG